MKTHEESILLDTAAHVFELEFSVLTPLKIQSRLCDLENLIRKYCFFKFEDSPVDSLTETLQRTKLFLKEV